jgi:hypothetical protein
VVSINKVPNENVIQIQIQLPQVPVADWIRINLNKIIKVKGALIKRINNLTVAFQNSKGFNNNYFRRLLQNFTSNQFKYGLITIEYI